MMGWHVGKLGSQLTISRKVRGTTTYRHPRSFHLVAMGPRVRLKSLRYSWYTL